MAKKILILDDGSHMKKSAVEALVRRLLMFWEVPGKSARRATVRQFVEAKPYRAPLSARIYVPEKLPPAEIGGCHFHEPTSPSWREYHRSAVPPSQVGA